MLGWRGEQKKPEDGVCKRCPEETSDGILQIPTLHPNRVLVLARVIENQRATNETYGRLASARTKAKKSANRQNELGAVSRKIAF